LRKLSDAAVRFGNVPEREQEDLGVAVFKARR
jgi:hypothetical protein